MYLGDASGPTMLKRVWLLSWRISASDMGGVINLDILSAYATEALETSAILKKSSITAYQHVGAPSLQ
jgi:hypothetical protein